jgi:hypothetical protein
MEQRHLKIKPTHLELEMTLALTVGLLAATLAGSPAGAAAGTSGSTVLATDHAIAPVRYAYTRVCSYGPRGWFLLNDRGRIIACRPLRPDGFDWVWREEGGRSGWYDRRDRRWR